MHCLLEVNPPLCRLTDLNSRSGTYVNGKREQTADLQHGDEIKGGTTVIKVSIADEVPPGTLTSSSSSPATTSGDFHLVMASPDWPTIPGYQLIVRVGSGGMGAVYRATRRSDGADVAIKVIKPADASDPVAVGRFLREGEMMSKLRHPNVVASYEAGAVGSLMFFAMEYVEGTDLARVVKEEGPLEVRRAVRLVMQTLLGLDHAHSQGIVPRHQAGEPVGDKREGTRSGQGHRLRPGAGLSGVETERVDDDRLDGWDAAVHAARTGHRLPQREAGGGPVLCGGDFVQPADQGTPIRGVTVADLLMKVLMEEPIRLESRRADIPAGLAALVRRAMARRPEARFADVREMARALAVFG